MNLSDMMLRNSRTVRLAAFMLFFPIPVSLAAQQAGAKTSPPKPTPDVIVFTNGDQLTGKLEKGEAGSITFQSDMAGEITVPLAKIKELRSSGSFALLHKELNKKRKEATAVEIGTVSYEDGDMIVAAAGASERVPGKNVDFLIDQTTYEKQIVPLGGRFNDKKLLRGWTGSMTGGATLVRATQNGSSYTAAAALVRAIPTVPYLPPKDRTVFGLTETYGKLTQPAIPQTTPPIAASTTVTDIFHTGLEQDEYFTPVLYALGSMAFDHDYSQGLRLQQVYGGGIGWTAIKDARQELDVKGQLQYEKQSFQVASNDQNLIGATIGESYTRKLPRSIGFTEMANVLPAFNNANAYSANASAGLMMPAWRRFNLSFTATDSFLNNPPVGFKKNSFQFVMGVSYVLP
jgi:Protein of unknown function, DUF481